MQVEIPPDCVAWDTLEVSLHRALPPVLGRDALLVAPGPDGLDHEAPEEDEGDGPEDEGDHDGLRTVSG